MTIKDDWINIDKDKKTIIHDSLQGIKNKLYTELGLDIEKDWRLIKVTESQKKYIIIHSLHRIPLKHLLFLEEEGFWFNDVTVFYNLEHPHPPVHKFPYNYIFIREDYVRRDRRFYEENYPVIGEEEITPSSSSLGAEII